MAEEIMNQEGTNQPQRKEVSPEKLKALQVAMDKIDIRLVITFLPRSKRVLSSWLQ